MGSSIINWVVLHIMCTSKKNTTKCSIFATKGITILTTSILSTAFTVTLAKLHWLKISAYMGCICISMEHLPLSWKTGVDVFTNFTFRIIKLLSQQFIHAKGSHFSVILAITFAVLEKTHMKMLECLCHSTTMQHSLDLHCNATLINHLI
jgi:hypothetical protein